MRIVAILLLLVGMNVAAIAGNEIKEVSGVVTDDKNHALAGAKVTFNSGYVVYTDMDGKFSLKNVPAGIYSITISYASFQDLEVDNYKLTYLNSRSLTFELNDR